ncbi:MAG: glycosyltransferase family 2 protein [candidate division KSB1 bacterium]|nr:glycosyltransferase family 2 protein [candidate division KSB1 bacterium]MDZ7333725.1 glycosyltransferase family 2 protein [candidate division KSB1 bacterium]MDZ7357066.1 glycosyltransferase family 2 protein [candidate division KSB1 bacterium]MDZ7375925.1 glycosyltransferase family 2 protein [candidate division KSB1 bacterium]MDZ7398849.1 glycosyltransferase family 2 protein [candidate division KSB1 bacterium]
MKKSLSIFFPVYNDWATIGSLVAQAITTAEKLTDDYEIILVNDGSRQMTVDVLNHLEKTYDKVRVVHHEKNRGYGGALRTGFKECKKDLIFYTDGDAQYDVTELTKLFERMNGKVDIVNGWKIKRSDPFYRVIIGKFYHYFTKWLFGFKIRDVDCDFRLMKREIFDNIELESDSGLICVEMIKKMTDAGYVFDEVGVTHHFRPSGKSEFFNFKRIFRVGVDMMKLWWKIQVKKQYARPAKKIQSAAAKPAPSIAEPDRQSNIVTNQAA